MGCGASKSANNPSETKSSVSGSSQVVLQPTSKDTDPRQVQVEQAGQTSEKKDQLKDGTDSDAGDPSAAPSTNIYAQVRVESVYLEDHKWLWIALTPTFQDSKPQKSVLTQASVHTVSTNQHNAIKLKKLPQIWRNHKGEILKLMQNYHDQQLPDNRGSIFLSFLGQDRQDAAELKQLLEEEHHYQVFMGDTDSVQAMQEQIRSDHLCLLAAAQPHCSASGIGRRFCPGQSSRRCCC